MKQIMVDNHVSEGFLRKFSPSVNCTEKKKGISINNKYFTSYCIWNGSVKIEIRKYNNNFFRLFGNLRRWYFGYKSLNDFNNRHFKKCLKMIAKRIGADYENLLGFNIKKIELGFNLKLESVHKKFIPCLVEYPRLKKIRWCKSTVSFKGTKYSVIYYDKLKELLDRKNGISKNTYDKVSKKYFFLRFEKKITSKSGTSLKTKITTLGYVIDNWSFLIDDCYNSFLKVKKVDLISGVKTLKRPMTSGEFKVFLIYAGLERLGFDLVFNYVDLLVVDRKSKLKNSLMDIFNNHRLGSECSDLDYINTAARNKLQRLDKD